MSLAPPPPPTARPRTKSISEQTQSLFEAILALDSDDQQGRAEFAKELVSLSALPATVGRLLSNGVMTAVLYLAESRDVTGLMLSVLENLLCSRVYQTRVCKVKDDVTRIVKLCCEASEQELLQSLTIICLLVDNVSSSDTLRDEAVAALEFCLSVIARTGVPSPCLANALEAATSFAAYQWSHDKFVAAALGRRLTSICINTAVHDVRIMAVRLLVGLAESDMEECRDIVYAHGCTEVFISLSLRNDDAPLLSVLVRGLGLAVVAVRDAVEVWTSGRGIEALVAIAKVDVFEIKYQAAAAIAMLCVDEEYIPHVVKAGGVSALCFLMRRRVDMRPEVVAVKMHSVTTEVALEDIIHRCNILASNISIGSAGSDRQPAFFLQLQEKNVIVGKQLGRGGFGTVYAGSLVRAGSQLPVAVKTLHEGADYGEFCKEANSMAALHYPFIVRFYGYMSTGTSLSIITELCSAGSVLDAIVPPNDELTWFERLRVVMHSARGFNYLHSWNPPILHRDVKCANLLIGEDMYGTTTVKVADFGLCRTLSKQDGATGMRGTPGWIAPEVILCDPYGKEADVYSFGILLWELLQSSRCIPYSEPEFIKLASGLEAAIVDGLRPKVPEDVQPLFLDLMEACWHKDAASRPSFDDVVASCLAMAKHGAYAREANPTLICPTPVGDRLTSPVARGLPSPSLLSRSSGFLFPDTPEPKMVDRRIYRSLG